MEQPDMRSSRMGRFLFDISEEESSDIDDSEMEDAHTLDSQDTYSEKVDSTIETDVSSNSSVEEFEYVLHLLFTRFQVITDTS
jgi:hypothetical protein